LFLAIWHNHISINYPIFASRNFTYQQLVNLSGTAHVCTVYFQLWVKKRGQACLAALHGSQLFEFQIKYVLNGEMSNGNMFLLLPPLSVGSEGSSGNARLREHRVGLLENPLTLLSVSIMPERLR